MHFNMFGRVQQEMLAARKAYERTKSKRDQAQDGPRSKYQCTEPALYAFAGRIPALCDLLQLEDGAPVDLRPMPVSRDPIQPKDNLSTDKNPFTQFAMVQKVEVVSGLFSIVETGRDIIGQEEGMKRLTTFLSEFSGPVPPIHRIALLHGRPGVGKTAAVHAVARDAGLVVIDVNASDTRSYPGIMSVLLKCGFGSTHLGKPLILLEEIDGADKSAVKALLDFVDRFPNAACNAPIIATCNEKDAPALKALKGVAFEIGFHRLFPKDSRKILDLVCKRSELQLSHAEREACVMQANGDVRQLVHFAHMHRVLGPKDEFGTVFDQVANLLRGKPVGTDRFGERMAASLLQTYVPGALCSDDDTKAMEDMSRFSDTLCVYDELINKDFDCETRGVAALLLRDTISSMISSGALAMKQHGLLSIPAAQRKKCDAYKQDLVDFIAKHR